MNFPRLRRGKFITAFFAGEKAKMVADWKSPANWTIGWHENKERRKMSDRFEPVILGFLCNWCAYAGGDLAGVSRLQYPPNMRAVRVMCSGMVHPDLVLEAFRRGADGVLVMG